MQINEKINYKPNGFGKIEYIRNNSVYDRVYFGNIVVNIGLQHIGDVMAGVDSTNLTLTKFGAGNASVIVNSSDLGNASEIGKMTGQVSGYPRRNGNVVENSYLVDYSELVGTWREGAIYFENNSCFSHFSLNEREKNSSEQVQIFYYVNFVA